MLYSGAIRVPRFLSGNSPERPNSNQVTNDVQTIRKRILEILKRRQNATANELAQELGMAPVSVRYHLDILQSDALIQVSKVRREGTVGRPQQVYTLTAAANEIFPDNFAALTAGLVRQLKKLLPPEQVEEAFRSLAREFAQELSLKEEATFEERMDAVTGFLSELGYFAQWEKAEGAERQEGSEEEAPGSQPVYLLYTFNCPYAGLSKEHQELCLMDLALVNELVGQPCQRVASLAEDHDCCTYRIRALAQEEDELDRPFQGEAHDAHTERAAFNALSQPAS